MYALKRIGKISREDGLKQLKENETWVRIESRVSANRPLNNWALFPKTWFPQVRKWSGNKKKFFKVIEKSGNFTSSQGKSLWKRSRKCELLRVHICSFPSPIVVFYHLKFFCTIYSHESCCIIGGPSVIWEFVWQVASLKLTWNKWTKAIKVINKV